MEKILRLFLCALIGNSTQKVKSFDLIPNFFTLFVFPKTKVYRMSVIGSLNKIFPRKVNI